MKHSKRKKRSSRLVTRRIIYRSHKRPHDSPQELKVDLPQGAEIDADYAAGLVAARTTMPLADVQIIKVVGPDEED